MLRQISSSALSRLLPAEVLIGFAISFGDSDGERDRPCPPGCGGGQKTGRHIFLASESFIGFPS
jgi:hypothetical protein